LLAVTAAGAAKVTIAGETVTVTPDPTGILYARLNATASGTTTVIAGTGGKKIRVLAYAFTVSAASTVQIQDDAVTPNILAGPFDLVAGGGIVFRGARDVPAFDTATSQGLVFNLGAAVNCRGHITYILV
jgi:hypothetical protein